MDSVAEVIAAADALSALLEAAAGPRGLKHPTHAKVITKARARVEKVLSSYFGRQEAALLEEIKPKIAAALAMHPLRESDDGEWVTINGQHVMIGKDGTVVKGNPKLVAALNAKKDRVQLAKDSAVRTGQHEQAIADKSEKVLAAAIGVPRTADNSAFDLRNDEVGIEVKTLVNGKNEKITMSKAALGRKEAERRADGIKAYTVVVDRRTGGLSGKATYYYREGLGSFRLGSMHSVTLGELKGIVKP